MSKQADRLSARETPEVHRATGAKALGRLLTKFIDPAVIFGIVVVFCFFAVVEWLVVSGTVSRAVIAQPSSAVAGLFSPDFRADLLQGARLTFSLVAVAIVLEVCVALPFGYFLYRKPNFGTAYEGWLAGLVAAPIFLLYPLFMVIFGRNNFTLIFMGFAAGVVPIIIYARTAFMTVPETLINVGKSFHLTEAQKFWKIMLPSGVLTIFVGIRLGLIYTLINIIAIEFLVDAGGLGRMVSDRYFRFDISGTYTAIFAIILVSISLHFVISRLERLVR